MDYDVSSNNIKLKSSHNAFHALGIPRSQTAHTDLNWPQPWFIRVAYVLNAVLK